METVTQWLIVFYMGIGAFNILFLFLETIYRLIKFLKNRKKK